MMPVAILCGGKGTRLAPLTDHTPKYLVDVAGRPFAAWQLELLASHGYTDIVLLTGHLGEQIEAAIGDGSAYGVMVRYSHDAVDGQGEAAAIQQALPLLGREFMVLYGDSYLDCDYAAIECAFWMEGFEYAALLTTWNGEDYGLRVYHSYPPHSALFYPMTQPFEEIGSHDGLARLDRLLSQRNA